MSLPFLGAGVSVRRPWHAALAALLPGAAPPVLEIVPQHFFAHPAALAPLADRYPIVFHDLATSIGTLGPDPIARAHLGRVRDLVRATPSAFLFTDHLAFTRTASGLDLGHLCPLWLDEGTFRSVRDRVHALQDTLGLPVALENPSSALVLPHSDHTEPDFLARLCAETGCGVLLDVTNVLVDSRNQGADPLERLLRYPLERVVAVHLAGATEHEHWVDTHAAPVAAESYALLAALRGRAPLRTIIVERDEHLPPLEDLLAEARHAQQIWREPC
jgi:uncharacterized protein